VSGSATCYDLIFDAVGKSSPARSKRALNEKGVFLSVLGSAEGEKTEDLVFLKGLIEAGKVKTVIDRCYPLEQIVEAHGYVESGQKKGNVAITV
jgi:NADPH:quinone reductase-like Zn-dependent oxidoreductase